MSGVRRKQSCTVSNTQEAGLHTEIVHPHPPPPGIQRTTGSQLIIHLGVSLCRSGGVVMAHTKKKGENWKDVNLKCIPCTL